MLDLTSAYTCLGKYYISPKENLNILKRNISSIGYNYFTRHVTGGKLDNTGETILMTFMFKPNMIPYIEGGPLGDEKYQFAFAYFHWMDKSVAAKAKILPFELHVVFTNTQYANYVEASKKNFGIVIMTTKHNNTETKYPNMYYEYLLEVRNPNDIYELDGEEYLGLSDAINVGGEYSVYVGKSTNLNGGSCNVDVIWIEYDEIHKIMPKEAQYFENLKTSDGSPLISRSTKTVTPKSKIYHSVYLLDYEKNNWPIEPFEGLGISFDSSVGLENMLWQNVLILLLLFQLY
ncbi:uncharacterized protein isoform X2 [Musca autumnalis]|uniref:uncharacterized protein isoform X2 n=1 Tax=Musca autumnalis TaxID=221902 RepID=UPI003CE77809